MVSVDRWTAAQQYEHGYWQDVATQIVGGAASRLDWYQWRADQLAQRLRSVGLQHAASGQARVVEVGSGPVGVTTFFPARERLAVDPLQKEYEKNAAFLGYRDPEVQYLEGVGEDLPCESGGYDLVIIENCIDHVRDVDGVMTEIGRVLKPDGVLYLTVNTRTRWGYVAHRILSNLQIDRGHPHTFTPLRAERLVRAYGFTPLSIEVESALRAHWNDLRAPDLRTRVKCLLGVSESLLTLVAQRRPDGEPSVDDASRP